MAFGSYSITKTPNPPRLQEVINTPEFQKYKTGGKSNLEAYNAFSADYQNQQNANTQTAQKEKANSSDALIVKQEIKNKIASSQGKRKEWYIKLLQSFDNTASNAGDAFERLDKYTINTIKNLHSVHTSIQDGINSATSGIVGSISGVTEGLQKFQDEAIHDIQGWGAGIKKALEPVGLCSAIGDLTGVVKNPLGAPQFLANSISSLVGKISPQFVENMDNSFKSLKLEGLQHLPSKMMGSIRNLATAADAILSVPFEIMSDVYNGLMEILEAIADLIDGLVSLVMNLAMAAAKALLDSIIPTDQLIEFFSAVGDLASFVGDIAGMVGGFSTVANIAGQVGDYASLASGALNNPLGAAIQFVPGASDALNQGLGMVGQVTSALRNPEQFLPPEIGQTMQKISQIPGLGFVGNMGYSVGDKLDALSDGVFAAALDKYADKSPMIKSFFNKPQDEPPAVDTQEAYRDDFVPAKAGSGVVDEAGWKAGPTNKILANGSITAYGMTETPPKAPTDGARRTIRAPGYGIEEEQAYNATTNEWQAVDTGTITAWRIKQERLSDGSFIITAPNGQRIKRFPDGREVAI